jgi:hypothetical protein
VLVEAGRHPDGIGKCQAEGLDREARIVRAGGEHGQGPQGRDGGPVRLLRIDGEQEGLGQRGGERHDHASNPVKSWRPSAPSGKGRAHRAFVKGKAA